MGKVLLSEEWFAVLQWQGVVAVRVVCGFSRVLDGGEAAAVFVDELCSMRRVSAALVDEYVASASESDCDGPALTQLPCGRNGSIVTKELHGAFGVQRLTCCVSYAVFFGQHGSQRFECSACNAAWLLRRSRGVTDMQCCARSVS